MSIAPKNVTAQLHYRAAGNPPSTLPTSAISNCFPGLEFDFRNLWRRIFDGIVLHEAHGFVVEADPPLERLKGRFLIQVGDTPTLISIHGPTTKNEDADLGSAFLEWSNALAEAVHSNTGETIICTFLDISVDPQTTETVELSLRPIFSHSQATSSDLPLVDETLLEAGELTQSLCSPWQNDYRECGCYYWAASRPDYVNVETTAAGTSIGNNWMSRQRQPKSYEPDNPQNPNQLNYEDLFRDWQRLLKFIVEGRDHD